MEGSFSADNDLVSAEDVEHTLAGSHTVNAGDYLKIVYFPEVTVPDVCALTSSNGECYSYP